MGKEKNCLTHLFVVGVLINCFVSTLIMILMIFFVELVQRQVNPTQKVDLQSVVNRVSGAIYTLTINKNNRCLVRKLIRKIPIILQLGLSLQHKIEQL